MSVADQWNYSNMVTKGSLLPQAYRNNPSNVMIAIGLGHSMGLSPAESLYRINVIQGKPTASAELIAAQVRKAGHKLRIQKDEKNMSVTATVVRCDDPDYPISVTRDAKWAKDMGLLNKDNYKKQPLTMLTWRAITAVAREACPEALYGVAYTPDEMHDLDPQPSQHQQVAAQNVEVQQQPQQPAQQAKPEPKADVVDLNPIRERFRGYQSARGGIDVKTATSELLGVLGVDHMADLTAEQVKQLCAVMDATIEQAFGNSQDGEYAEDVEF